MKRTLMRASLSLLVATGLVLQCGKKGNPVSPPVTPATPPNILSAYPAAHAAGVPRNTLIYLVFDRGMNQSATAGALTVERMTGTTSWRYNILIFKPDSLFRASDTVKFTIGTGAQDNGGTALAAAASYSFVCGAGADTVRPAVAGHAPTGSAVAVDARVAASCSKKLAPWADIAIALKQGSSAVAGNASLLSDSVLQFVPSGLSYNTPYTSTVDTNAVDRCGNRMSSVFAWTFTTIADTVRPFVITTGPAGGDTLVSVNAPVKVHFSEPMDTASAVAALSATPALHFRSSWSGDSVMTLTMTDTLSFHTAYQVAVSTGAMDKAGNHLAAAYPFSFTTARGISIACSGINQYYLYQQADLHPEGNHGTYLGARQVRFSPDSRWLYLLASEGLHVIDARNHYGEAVLTNLSNHSYGIAVSPNGLRLAVSDTANSRVFLIDAGSGALLDSVNTIGAAPKGMAFSANSGYLYVLCQFNNRVEIYNTGSIHATPAVVTVPNGGEELAIAPAGDRVFAACGTGLSVIRTSDNTDLFDITGVSNHPFGLAVSPDGQHLAVSCYDEGAVKVFNAQASAASSPLFTVAVGTGSRPKGLCYSPDGKYLYVALSGTSQVKRLQRSGSYAADTTLTVGAGPWGIAVTP